MLEILEEITELIIIIVKSLKRENNTTVFLIPVLRTDTVKNFVGCICQKVLLKNIGTLSRHGLRKSN